MACVALLCTEVRFVQVSFPGIYYYRSNKSNRKETCKMHLLCKIYGVGLGPIHLYLIFEISRLFRTRFLQAAQAVKI